MTVNSHRHIQITIVNQSLYRLSEDNSNMYILFHQCYVYQEMKLKGLYM